MSHRNTQTGVNEMTNTFTINKQTGNMFTFNHFQNGELVAFVRGFGANAAEALQDAKKELSMHAAHFAKAPASHKARAF